MRISKCFIFVGLINLAPSVSNLFRGIPFSYEDKLHEHIQESGGSASIHHARGKIFRDLFLGLSNGAETEGASEREILWNNEEMNREVRKNILIFDSLSINPI